MPSCAIVRARLHAVVLFPSCMDELVTAIVLMPFSKATNWMFVRSCR